jgi:hypothetical protein
MMLHHFSSLVLVVLGALCTAERNHLDTDRPLDIFARPDFVDGATYVSTFQLDQSTDMEILGFDSDVEMQFEGEQSWTVSSLPEGGKEIDMVTNHLAMHTEMFGVSMDFDSDDEENDDELGGAFAPLKDLLGKVTTITIDDEGNLVETKDKDIGDITFDPDANFGQEIEQAKEEQANGTPSTDATSQYQQLTRLAKALPDGPVKPGDSWEVLSVLMDGIGSVSGTATLLGYQLFEQHDVAVIEFEGTIDIDMDAATALIGGLMPGADDMSGDVQTTSSGIAVHDAVIKSKMFWDNTAKLMCWSQSNQTMIMDMPNPLDETSTVTAFVATNTTVTMDIVD